MTHSKKIIHKIGSINTKTPEERVKIMQESIEVLRQNDIDFRAFEGIDDEEQEKIMRDKKDLIDFLLNKIQEEEIWIADGSNSNLQDELAQTRIFKYRKIVNLLYDIDRDITHCAKCGLDLGPVYCPKCYRDTHPSLGITNAQQKVINMICENLNIECDAIDMESARDFISKNIDASKEATARYRKQNFKPRTDGWADIDCDYNGEPNFDGRETFEGDFM